MSSIDPLNYCVVRIHTFFNETPVAKATGFFVEGFVDQTPALWLVTNWHVLTGRNAIIPGKVLNQYGAIPNRLRIGVPSLLGPNGQKEESTLFLHEQFIELYDSVDIAVWYQHTAKNKIDVAVVNLGQSQQSHLIRGIGAFCSDSDMAIEIGGEVFILGYPLGFSHFANTPIWKRGSIASEPQMETVESMNKIMIDATTRSGMSGSPVIMRRNTHYVSEAGNIIEKHNATRIVGIYASRPAPEREPTQDEIDAGFIGHEIGYVFKAGCVTDVIQSGIRGPNFGEEP